MTTSFDKSTGLVKPWKNSVTETTTPLGASATFNGPWHDSTQDGTTFVEASGLLTGGGTATLAIQQTDDTTNFTPTIAQSRSLSSGSVSSVYASVRARFWRIQVNNSATPMTTLEVVSTASVLMVPPNGNDVTSGAPATNVVQIVNLQGPVAVADNITNPQFLANQTGLNNVLPLLIALEAYGGAFSGTANAALSGWSKYRTPTIFKQITATAAGNTAIWTPGSGNKFRLLKFKIQVTANAALAAAGIEVISFQDAAVAISGLVHEFWLPAAAGATQNLAYDTGWIDLGSFGFLSSTANNVLNLNLGTALSTGLANVIVAGTEE